MELDTATFVVTVWKRGGREEGREREKERGTHQSTTYGKAEKSPGPWSLG